MPHSWSTLPTCDVAPQLVLRWGAAQPAIIEDKKTIETAVVLRSGWFIELPPVFCLFGQPVEFGHALEQLVERVGHKLLGRASIHRTGQTKLEMTIRVEAERERRLPLLPGAARERGARRRAGAGVRDHRDCRLFTGAATGADLDWLRVRLLPSGS